MSALAASVSFAPVWEPRLVVASGEVAAPIVTFDDLLDRYQAELYRFALHLTRNRCDADDLYQETMLRAFRAFGRLREGSNHRAWLYKIATNTFLADRKKRGRVASLDEQTSVVIPVDEPDRAACIDATALLEDVAAFVEGLPPKQRTALVLRKYQGLGYGDIATTLRCSEVAARANVHEALRKLRDCFGDRL